MSDYLKYHAGLDIGSTTLKLVVTDSAKGDLVFSDYQRHHADIPSALRSSLGRAADVIGHQTAAGFVVTGSAGMGLAETYGQPFLQEVIAAAAMVARFHPDIRTLVDIGGEDAKMIFFSPGRAPDMRMNGSCAGGTGAFIDQIATLLGCDVSELNGLAMHSDTIHPIASRCGVFAKTDIQNLLSRNVATSDIAASAFHALAQQIVTTLARGHDIRPGVLFCGGPLAFIPTLRDACREVMGIGEHDCILPDNAELVPALGCAVAPDLKRRTLTIDEFLAEIEKSPEPGLASPTMRKLPALFSDGAEYDAWKQAKESYTLPCSSLSDLADHDCWLGIDSGSTTTKIVAVNRAGRIVFTFYEQNNGNPLQTVYKGLTQLHESAREAGCPDMKIISTAVTGYGEDLIKAAFNFEHGLVETIAHYKAARYLDPDVSFILDIGGQDMKATFIENGAIVRLDINEACSSGCGSFIDGFARTLNHSAAGFSQIACASSNPCDLGTRCTVFMNSKVKQSLRENAPLSDIAAGLAYSVAKNCLYKVLKLKSISELGEHIVLQGGTMRNHAVVRAFEKLTGLDVVVAPMPELMGAYGASLHAQASGLESGRLLDDLVRPMHNTVEETSCPGCENHCSVRKHTFANGNTFFAGNKCEKIYTNKGASERTGANLYNRKYKLLFGRNISRPSKTQTNIGIPRVLNFYENFPFWHALLTGCGLNVILSASSTFKLYGKGVGSIMSDNICFPAKLVHGHIHDLAAKKADRIFMPFVVREEVEDDNAVNSYNCPIVTGYSDVIRSAMDPAGKLGIPFDSPTVSFHDPILLKKACRDYMTGTFGISTAQFNKAFAAALDARKTHVQDLLSESESIIRENGKANRPLIVLAGRPYHADPLIQHKVADMIAGFGADVVSEDIVRQEDLDSNGGTVGQWTYPSRILKAAAWVAKAPAHVHFVQITSFGCGPDAFIIDSVGDLLRQSGKSHTILKVDDVNNPGSLRLRIRSLIDSLSHRNHESDQEAEKQKNASTPSFHEEDNRRTILLPFFSEIYSPFIPVMLKHMGYRAVNLPKPDNDSIDYGLQYANNEVCYPATLVVGDIIRAMKSGQYNEDEIAVAITQTGGQCRASNYISLIKKALVTAGYGNVPVISMGTDVNAVINDQPGFHPKIKGNIKYIIATMLYADSLAQMFYASAPRERTPNAAVQLRDRYITAGNACLVRKDLQGLYSLLRNATHDFNGIINADITVPRIGIVGEIYVRCNPSGNRNIIDWLISQGIEPVVPPLLDFFLQELPNRRHNRNNNLARFSILSCLDKAAYWWVRYYQRKFERETSKFVFHHPSGNIYEKSRSAERIINLAAQYGEGWLIPAELASFAENGIHHAVSLQPFGCIANHLVAKGIEKRVCDLYPEMNLLFLDIDSGASEANLFNRLHFMIQNARRAVKEANSPAIAQ